MKTLFRRLTAAVCSLALCLTAVYALNVEQAITLLEENYIDPLPDEAYAATTLDELFGAIGDPYTYYMSAEENASFYDRVKQEDSIVGIGVSVELTAEGFRVTSVLDGGGAADAGLSPGDLIIAADGVSCVPATQAQIGLFRGEVGTWITLTVRHRDGTTRDCRVQRRTVSVHNTKVSLLGDTGIIDCDSFGSQTEEYFTEGVTKHAAVSRWIIDLRSNLGGMADEAVGALGLFTGPGNKLFYRQSNGRLIHSYYLQNAVTDKPALVLVNGDTASASELFAGGIRAESAGIVIGSRTYGKGTAQIVLSREKYPELFDGDSLKVTTYRFYCADGDTTDRIGVLPTLLVHDECAKALAMMLSAQPPASGNSLRLPLGGRTFYVDLDTALTGENVAALSELFSALAPDVPVYCTIDGMEIALDPATAARYYGVDYENRGLKDSELSPYAAQIETLAVYGLIAGDGTGRFRPSRTLTRAELATMLSNVLNVILRRSVGFTDVPDDSWYAPSVNAMAKLGFMKGVGDGRFEPNGTLTQEQLITVMGRFTRFLNFTADDYALSLTDEALASFSRFSDWARTDASVLTECYGNLLYADLSDISPDAPATREQAAATLYNILRGLNILSY